MSLLNAPSIVSCQGKHIHHVPFALWLEANFSEIGVKISSAAIGLAVVKSGLFGIWLDRYLHLWCCGQHSGHSYQLHSGEYQLQSGEQEGPCIHFQVGTVTSGVGIRPNDTGSGANRPVQPALKAGPLVCGFSGDSNAMPSASGTASTNGNRGSQQSSSFWSLLPSFDPSEDDIQESSQKARFIHECNAREGQAQLSSQVSYVA